MGYAGDDDADVLLPLGGGTLTRRAHVGTRSRAVVPRGINPLPNQLPSPLPTAPPILPPVSPAPVVIIVILLLLLTLARARWFDSDCVFAIRAKLFGGLTRPPRARTPRECRVAGAVAATPRQTSCLYRTRTTAINTRVGVVLAGLPRPSRATYPAALDPGYPGDNRYRPGETKGPAGHDLFLKGSFQKGRDPLRTSPERKKNRTLPGARGVSTWIPVGPTVPY